MNILFTPFDIIWIKNVNAESKGQAYLNKDDIFDLHFPNNHETQAKKPKPNEIILLYQKSQRKFIFTHLVTPIDDKINNDSSNNYNNYRKVKVIAKVHNANDILRDNTKWKTVNFRGICNGNPCKIKNVKNINNNLNDLLIDIWNKFSPFFKDKSIIEENIIINNLIEEINPDITVKEGRKILLSHFIRERNKKIVADKKQQAIDNGKLICEVCGFDFNKIYGVSFIECHHKIPISSSTTTITTTLNDLSLVCSNCHRMLHKLINNKFLSIEELKAIIK